MTFLPRLRAAALCTLALATQTTAQPAAAQPKKTPADKPARASAAPADPLAAQRLATAVSLVNTIADEARGFRDPSLRARVQMQAADSLWDTDQERARTLFRRAWDAAEQGDAENQRRRDSAAAPEPGGPGRRNVEEERRVQSGRPGALASSLNQPNLRSEVLRLAARRDRALGEEFLAKLEEARRQEDKKLAADTVAESSNSAAANSSAPGGASSAPARRDPHEAAPDEARRLRLAQSFLEEGDTERALQFAGPALSGINTAVMEFLVNLRERSAEAADQRFLALLARGAADPATDANAVLILSSYVLTPHYYMYMERGGGTSSSQRRPEIKPFDLPPALRASFARFAAQALLRPLPPAGTRESRVARVGAYMVAGRLMPFFEQTLPEVVAPLRAQMASIMPEIPDEARRDLEGDMQRGLVPEEQRRGPDIQNALDAAARTDDPQQRDLLYLQAALGTARQDFSKARDIAAKIDSADLRRQAQNFIDFAATNQSIQKKDGMEVLRLAQSGELTQTQRTWAYTEAARLLKDDRARALEALESAAAAARAIDAEDPDRARSLVAVATQFYAVDRNRAWELMADVVKAANAEPEFTGSDAGLAARVQAKGMRSTINFPAPSFDLGGVFAALAREDMNRAVSLAQTFTAESPRAVATLAIARAVLEEKQKPARAAR